MFLAAFIVFVVIVAILLLWLTGWFFALANGLIIAAVVGLCVYGLALCAPPEQKVPAKSFGFGVAVFAFLLHFLWTLI